MLQQNSFETLNLWIYTRCFSSLCRIHIECLNDWDKMRTEWLLSSPHLRQCLEPAAVALTVSREYETWILIDLFSLREFCWMFKGKRREWIEMKSWKCSFSFLRQPLPTLSHTISLFFSCHTSNNSHVFHRRQDSSHTQHTAAAAHGYRPIVEGLKWGLASDLCSIEEKREQKSSQYLFNVTSHEHIHVISLKISCYCCSINIQLSPETREVLLHSKNFNKLSRSRAPLWCGETSNWFFPRDSG